MNKGFRYLAIFVFAFIFIIGGVVNYSFADTMESLSVEESSSESTVEEIKSDETTLDKGTVSNDSLDSNEDLEVAEETEKLNPLGVALVVIIFLVPGLGLAYVIEKNR